MNNHQERKKPKRNSSSSQFNLNINPGINQNQNMNYSNNNIPLVNPNYVNCSIYTGNSLNNEMNINKRNECPNCLSYHQKLNEKNLLIQKLQNQISRFSSLSSNSSNIIPNMNKNDNNRQVNNFKKIISDLKSEISKKDEKISQISLDYDEQTNYLISKNNQLEQELSKIKRQNVKLNKSNNNFQKMIKLKDEEINGYKEKVKALLATITVKNDYLNKLKEDSKNKIEDLENKYINLSSNYNTLAISSGANKLINYDTQKDSNDNDSDFSNEEDNLADILINTGKLAKKESKNTVDLIKSKSQNIFNESITEKNNKTTKNMNNNFLPKQDRISTPKMSSTQSSWMISSAPHELQIIHRDFDNIKKKLDISRHENKKLNQKFILINEQKKKKIEAKNKYNYKISKRFNR